MGNQSSSESLASTQSIVNQINNISNENCINLCSSSIQDIHILIQDSDIEGNINAQAACSILGASCVLKASLSSDVQNTEKNKQLGLAMQEEDPIALIGPSSSSTINETSNQSVANRVTNILNSTCQANSVQSADDVNIEVIGSKVVGNINVDANGQITKSKCIIDNVSRTTLSNDLTNSQTAKTFQGSPLLFIILAIVAIAVMVMIVIVILGVGGLGVLGVGGVGALAVESGKNKPRGQRSRPTGPPPPYNMRPRPSAPPQTYRVR